MDIMDIYLPTGVIWITFRMDWCAFWSFKNSATIQCH